METENELRAALALVLEGPVRADDILHVAGPQALLDRDAAGDPLAQKSVVVAQGAAGHEPPDRARDRMRRLLFARGFLPLTLAGNGGLGAEAVAYGRSALIADKGAAGVAAESAVSLSHLGNLGRFGNQLFQYAFVKFYALRNHLTLKVPSWQGEHFFALHDVRSRIAEFPELLFGAFDDDDLVLWDEDRPPRDVDFRGTFQEIPACWLPHRRFLGRLFSLRDDWRRPLEAALAAQRAGGRTIVALHLRRYDYPEFDGLSAQRLGRVPVAWYRAWLETLWPTLANPILFVATDGGAEIVRQFADYPLLQLDGAALPADLPGHLRDFFVLSQADCAAIANSSFSRMAALLAENQACVLPDIAARRFLPYEPWADRAFWDRFVDPATDQGLEASGLTGARRRGIHYRLARGEAMLRSPDALPAAASPAPDPCKLCGGAAPLFGVVDFNCWGGAPLRPVLPLSGQPIYYRRCGDCGFLYTRSFDDWDTNRFKTYVYNEEFLAHDPAILDPARPAADAAAVAALFPERRHLRLLDYGANNLAFATILGQSGFAAVDRIDFFDAQLGQSGGARYDIVTCLDILERVPDPAAEIATIARCLDERGIALLSLTLQPSDIEARGIGWWHIGPRSGHISLFSREAFARAWRRHGFDIAVLESGLIAAHRGAPDFAAHLIDGRAAGS